MKKKETAEVIRRLNVEPGIYRKMFDAPVPDEFTVVMRYVRMPNCHHDCVQAKYDEIHDRFAQLASRVPESAADSGIAAGVELIVGNAFASGKGIWCDGLCEYRAMIRIKMSALLEGEDPDNAYGGVQEGSDEPE